MHDDHLQRIRAAKAGDREAFTHLVRSYKDFLFRTAFAIVRDYGEAEDVVQEAFVKAFLSLRTLKDERAFPSWISTIATRIALDTVRRRTNDGEYNDSVPNPEMMAGPPISDLRLDLSQALAKLTPEHRAVIVLREVQGFDYQEISNILEIPLGTVRSRIHAARMQLRHLLYPHDERGDEMMCEDVSELISAYVDQELSVGEMMTFQAHLEDCESCKTRLREFASLSQLTKDAFTDVFAPVSIEDSVLQEILSIQQTKQAYRLMWVVIGSAVVMTVLAFGGGLTATWDFLGAVIRLTGHLAHVIHLLMLRLVVGQGWLVPGIVVVGVAITVVSLVGMRRLMMRPLDPRYGAP